MDAFYNVLDTIKEILAAFKNFFKEIVAMFKEDGTAEA